MLFKGPLWLNSSLRKSSLSRNDDDQYYSMEDITCIRALVTPHVDEDSYLGEIKLDDLLRQGLPNSTELSADIRLVAALILLPVIQYLRRSPFYVLEYVETMLGNINIG